MKPRKPSVEEIGIGDKPKAREHAKALAEYMKRQRAGGAPAKELKPVADAMWFLVRIGAERS